MRKWKLEDAKNRFSQLVRETLREGPQLVTRNGHDAVVVVSAAEYARLTSPRGLTAFLRDSPLADALAEGDLELDRPTDPAPDIDL